MYRSDFTTRGHLPFTQDRKLKFTFINLDYKYRAHRHEKKNGGRWGQKKVITMYETVLAPFCKRDVNHFHTYLGVKTMECKWPYLNTIFTPRLCITRINEHKQT